MPPSSLEHKFKLFWNGLGGPKLIEEYRFCPERRWRSDFYHEPTRTLIEIEGGLWIKSRHRTGSGFAKDAEKYAEAAFMGFKVFRLTQEQINTTFIERLIKHIKEN